MIEKIKRHDNIILLVILILISSGTILRLSICASDEIWNFNNSFKIFNGYKMYTDMNIIIPPMFFYLANFVFHILGANILSFRIYGIIIYTINGLIIYNIFKELKVSKKYSFCFLMIAQIVIYPIFNGSANYNFLAITFVLLGIFILIKDSSNYNWIIQGIAGYLILFTKQNIGIYYLLAIILTELITNGINKKSVKKIFAQFFVTAVLSIFNIILMYIEGNLFDFINFTVLGIGEFTHNFSIGIDVLALISINIIILITTIYVNKRKIWDKDIIKKINILAIFSIVISFLIYPIINLYHIYVALIIPLITLSYILHNLIIKEFNLNIIINSIGICIAVGLFIYSLNGLLYFIGNAKFNLPYKHPYYGGIIEKEVEEKINNIDKYILEEESNEKYVIILSKEAGLYMLPLHKNNGIFDLPFLGNLGREGEDGLIEKINNLNSYKILINKEENYWQDSEKMKEYIRLNFTKVGEIEEFEIFE